MTCVTPAHTTETKRTYKRGKPAKRVGTPRTPERKRKAKEPATTAPQAPAKVGYRFPPKTTSQVVAEHGVLEHRQRHTGPRCPTCGMRMPNDGRRYCDEGCERIRTDAIWYYGRFETCSTPAVFETSPGVAAPHGAGVPWWRRYLPEIDLLTTQRVCGRCGRRASSEQFLKRSHLCLACADEIGHRAPTLALAEEMAS